jgi:hypothetical protein
VYRKFAEFLLLGYNRVSCLQPTRFCFCCFAFLSPTSVTLEIIFNHTGFNGLSTIFLEKSLVILGKNISSCREKFCHCAYSSLPYRTTFGNRNFLHKMYVQLITVQSTRLSTSVDVYNCDISGRVDYI